MIKCYSVRKRDLKMKKMTVMYIWNDLTMGGATQSLLDTLQEMNKKANCIVVIREKNQIIEYLQNLNVEYLFLPFPCDCVAIDNYSKEDEKLNFLESYESANILADMIRQKKVDLVHINSSTSSVGAIAALLAGIPYIWHIRELIREHFDSTFFNIELKKELFAQSSKLITISDCVKQSYLEQFNLDSIRLYNGLRIENYEGKLTNRRFNRKILLVGTLTKSKGQWDAVKAIELLIGQGYDTIELFIIGDGDESLRWRIQKYIQQKNLKQNVHLISFKENLKPYREQVSYSITSSKMEALGRTTIEAMLAGNIVIGTDTGGTKELIGEKEERGYLYHQGNYIELAHTLIKAIEDTDEKKNQILQRAQEYAKKEFDSFSYCEELFQIYMEINTESKYLYNTELVEKLKYKYEELKTQQNILLTKKLKDLNKNFQKAKLLNVWTLKWLEIKQKGFSIGRYLKKESIHTVAIYGMASLGYRLYDELKEENIKVKYVMDRGNKEIGEIIWCVDPEQELPEVDAVIVTVLSEEYKLINWLQTKCNYKVLGITHIINDIIELC